MSIKRVSHVIDPALKLEIVVLEDSFHSRLQVQTPIFRRDEEGRFTSEARGAAEIESEIQAIEARMAEHENGLSAHIAASQLREGVTVNLRCCADCTEHKQP